VQNTNIKLAINTPVKTLPLLTCRDVPEKALTMVAMTEHKQRKLIVRTALTLFCHSKKDSKRL